MAASSAEAKNGSAAEGGGNHHHAGPMNAVRAVSTADDMNPSCRNTMEDAHVTVDGFAGNAKQGYFAVYDGHGGRGVVEYLEQHLHHNVELEVSKMQENDMNVEECLQASFLFTDIKTKEAELMMSGSTAVSCFLQVDENGQRHLHTANCGDARAVLSRGGVADRLTLDHKANNPEEKARIEEEGGFVLRGRVLGILAVSRSFGDHALKQFVTSMPYTCSRSLNDDDSFLIIACDGVWDVMSDQEAVDFVRERIDSALAQDAGTTTPYSTFEKTVARALVDEALHRMSTDNITVQIVLL